MAARWSGSRRASSPARTRPSARLPPRPGTAPANTYCGIRSTPPVAFLDVSASEGDSDLGYAVGPDEEVLGRRDPVYDDQNVGLSQAAGDLAGLRAEDAVDRPLYALLPWKRLCTITHPSSVTPRLVGAKGGTSSGLFSAPLRLCPSSACGGPPAGVSPPLDSPLSMSIVRRS